MKIIITIIVLILSLNLSARTVGFPVEIDLAEESRQLSQIKNLSTIELPSVILGGKRLHSLSSLAYSPDDKILYALSDKGALFWFRMRFSDTGMLQNITWLATYKLKNKKGTFLEGKKNSDSEGMDIVKGNNGIAGDSQLLISFERKHRIWLMDRKGRFLRNIRLPRLYSGGRGFHKKNQGLEAISYHPQFGVLSALERPAKDKGSHNIFTIKPYRTWQIPRLPYKKASLTAMQTMPNGDLLLLERSFVDIFKPIAIGLKRIRLNPKGRTIHQQQLAIFDNSDKWYMDNFEGLAYIQNNRYCMVSDNNDGKWQRTLLTCFEVKY